MPKRERHPPITNAFEIGRLGAQLFERSLPPSRWLVRQQTPDFYLDYKVEFVASRTPTGKEFSAQVKGTGVITGKRLRKRMDARHLNYYLSVRQPVFIFLVDINSEQVYWLFAQRYLHEKVRKGRLTRQESVTVDFERANSLADLNRFEAALTAAWRYMEELFPGSIRAAVRHRAEALRSLDPRFDVSVGWVDGKEFWTAKPNVPISLKSQFSVNRQEAESAFANWQNHGTPARLDIQNLRFKGSPIFESMGNSSAGTLELSPHQQSGTVQLEFERSEERLRTVDFHGCWRLGAVSSTFEGRLGNSPLRLKSTLIPDAFVKGQESGLELTFDWGAWTGKPISVLPEFDAIDEVVGALESAQRIVINWYVSDQWACSAEQNGSGCSGGADMQMRWLRACREIARKCRKSPLLPQRHEITKEQWSAIFVLQKLLNNEEFTSDCAEGVVSLSPPFPNIPTEKPGKPPSELKIEGDQEFDFFGEPIQLRTVNIFTEMVLHDERPAKMDARIKFVGTSTNMHIIKVAGESIGGGGRDS